MPREREGALEIGRARPTLARVLQVARRVTELGMSVAVPARVLLYDATDQTVEVEVGFQAVRYTVDDERKVPALVLKGIPVAWQRGSTGYLTHPLLPASTGQLIVNDRAMSQWRRLGVADDPQQTHTHNLGDAVFYPGLHPDTNPIAPATDQAATVLHDDTAIKLGRLAALAVARVTDKTVADASMTIWLTQMGIAINQLAVILNVAGPVIGAPGSVTPVAPPTPSDFGVISTGSAKVTAE